MYITRKARVIADSAYKLLLREMSYDQSNYQCAYYHVAKHHNESCTNNEAEYNCYNCYHQQ